MSSQVDKQTEKALQLDLLLNKIVCFSEIGNKLHRNFKTFKSNQKEDLLSYYDKIDVLLTNIRKGSDFISALGSNLNHFQWILKTLEDAQNRTLELFEIFEIKFFIYFYQKTVEYLRKKNIKQIIPLRDFSELFSYLDLEKNNTPSFHLNPAYSVKFQELTDKISHHKNSIDTEYAQLKAKLVKDLNLFNFNGKITVSRMNTNQIAMLSNYADLQIENENFANITFSLRKNKEILDQEKEISKLENALFEEEKKVRELISARIRTESESLIFAFHEIAELDLLLAKAIFANKYKCVCPQINEEYRIEMAETENLILKDELKELKLEYQSQDFKINKSVVILTGANMAGKTSVLKTIGQCAALLIYGIPVPAKSANLFIPDFISFSGPLTHEHRADLSSFAIEVVALQHVLEKKNKGLILMDEFARGTNPLEGTALSQSVIDFFSRHEKGLFISATHFNPPAHTENAQHFRLLGLSDQDFEYLKSLDKNYLKNNLKEIHKYFNYKIIPVNIDSEIPKAAYKIAELLGLDGEILDKAKELYNEEI